jgi:hypothetical protein
MQSSFSPIVAAARHMDGFAGRWFVSGGWAIDMFLGQVTRKHADIEIGIDRADQHLLHSHLIGWSLDKAIQTSSGTQWIAWGRGEQLQLPIHQIRASRANAAPAEIEFFLNERSNDQWRSRRHPELARPVGESVTISSSLGIPFLVPEIQLLFKAKHTREKDQADFARALPRLNPHQRRWLADALRVYYPGHPWLADIG